MQGIKRLDAKISDTNECVGFDLLENDGHILYQEKKSTTI